MRDLILADLQGISSAGVRYITNKIKDIGLIYTADNKLMLIQLLAKYPDSLIILDYTLFDFGDLTELVILYEKYPGATWMLFSDELSDSFLRQIIANSMPFSIVYKSHSLDEIETAIRKSLIYENFVAKSIENHIRVLKHTFNNTADPNLTITEKEILKEIALGKTTKEIASNRNVSFHTVMTHRKNIFRKLEVNNVHEASKYAIRAGIVDVLDYYI